MLNANSNLSEIRFVLFDQDPEVKRKEKARIDAGEFPVVQGFMEIGPRKREDGQKNPTMQMSAFFVPGQKFLSLTIQQQEKDGDKYNTIRTFRGTLNKGNGGYFGYIHEQFVAEVEGKKQFSKGDFEFSFNATKHSALVEAGEIKRKSYFESTKWSDVKAKEADKQANSIADESEAEIGF
jgi:hypothetical protein